MSADIVVRGGGGGGKALSAPGVSMKTLRFDRATGTSTTLIRFAPGAQFPAHDHPGGEDGSSEESTPQRVNAGAPSSSPCRRRSGS